MEAIEAQERLLMSAASPSKEAVLFCDIPDEEPFEGSDPVQFLVAGAQSKHKAWYMGGAQFSRL